MVEVSAVVVEVSSVIVDVSVEVVEVFAVNLIKLIFQTLVQEPDGHFLLDVRLIQDTDKLVEGDQLVLE